MASCCLAEKQYGRDQTGRLVGHSVRRVSVFSAYDDLLKRDPARILAKAPSPPIAICSNSDAGRPLHNSTMLPNNAVNVSPASEPIT